MTMTHTGTADPAAPNAPDLPRRRRSSRVTTSLWVAALAGILAFVGFLVVTAGAKGEPVAVAARDLAAGEQVGPGDFRMIDLDAPPALAVQLLRAADVNGLATDPQVTTHAILAGELVHRPDFTATGAPAQQRSMSIPVAQTHAVGGALKRGDVVDVIDASQADPAYVLTSARVLAVTDPGGSRLSGVSRDYAITVAVDERSALRVAAAIAANKLEVVRATGAPPATTSPTTTTTLRRG